MMKSWEGGTEEYYYGYRLKLFDVEKRRSKRVQWREVASIACINVVLLFLLVRAKQLSGGKKVGNGSKKSKERVSSSSHLDVCLF
eukprot:scaffold7550_cov149-Skeletonema_marinoi.AAC.4